MGGIVVGVANGGVECFYISFVVNGWNWLLVVAFSLGLGLLFWREVGWSRMFCWDCYVVWDEKFFVYFVLLVVKMVGG